jgi:hypothetical protein
MPVRVLNTGDYKPMDHAPMPHDGGSTDDQRAHGKRRTVPLIGVQPHMQVLSRPRKVREEERLRYQKIKRGSGIIFTRWQRNEIMITHAFVCILHCQLCQCDTP